jgi:predicted small integral membrane protein
MFSIYLAALVFGGTFTLLSAYGHFTDRSWSVIEKDGPLYTLRALVYSLVGFGGFGMWISRIDSGLGTGLELVLSILAGLMVGGGASAGLAFLLRGRARTQD